MFPLASAHDEIKLSNVFLELAVDVHIYANVYLHISICLSIYLYR